MPGTKIKSLYDHRQYTDQLLKKEISCLAITFNRICVLSVIFGEQQKNKAESTIAAF